MSFTHLDAVLDEVRPLGQLFAAAGHRLFLVGGIVRDQWLDFPLDASSDIDLTTDARPTDIKSMVAPLADDLWTQGERFGTIGLRAGGRAFEITTHRAESYDPASRKPQVSFGDDITVDLSRRDFTVNAMAIALPHGELVDPHGGVQDLEAQRLRTPLSPRVSFTDDPLRMLRAARFASKYSLEPDEDLVAAATALRERLRIVAIERIEVEVRRLLGLPDAVTGLRFLARTGVLGEVLAYGDPSQLDRVAARADTAIDKMSALSADWELRLAAIGLVVFDTPDRVRTMCGRLRLSRDNTRSVEQLCRSAAEVARVVATVGDGAFPAAALRRWLHDCGRQDRTRSVQLAQVLAQDGQGVERFDAAISVLTTAEPTDDIALLDGEHIMELLDIESGPAVGQAHRFLQNEYYEHGPMTQAEQIRRLKAWHNAAS